MTRTTGALKRCASLALSASVLALTGSTFALAAPAQAASPLPSLTGEYFSAWSYNDQNADHNTVSTNGTCGADTVTLTYNSSGDAYGPYSGTFHAAGTATFRLDNPSSYSYDYSDPDYNYEYHYSYAYGNTPSAALAGAFSIDSATGQVNGTLSGTQLGASCYEQLSSVSEHYGDDFWSVDYDSEGHYTSSNAYGQADWKATITRDGASRTAAGDSFFSFYGYSYGYGYHYDTTYRDYPEYDSHYGYGYDSRYAGTYASFTETYVNTAPAVAVIGVTEGSTYDRGSVPAAACTVSDAEDGATTVAARLSSPSGPRSDDGLGTVTASCSYTDSGSLTGTASVTYTVADTLAPVLSLPAGPVQAEATSPTGAPVTYTATARDAVDGVRTVTCTPAPGSQSALGSTTVTCTAVDIAGNTASGTVTVTVADTTAPQISADSVTVSATSAAGATATYTAGTTDAVDGPSSATCTPASGSRFALGTTQVTCTASDTADNRATAGLSVTVQDTGAPVVDTPAATTVEATGPAGAAVTLPAVYATDDVDGRTTATCTPGSGTFPLGTTTVTCSATDKAHNTGTSTYQVTVADTTPAVITTPPASTSEATSGFGAEVTFAAATARDAVSGTVPATCDHTSGSTFALGTTTVTCTAVDAATNRSAATFLVTVRDTSAPRVSVPASVTTEATSPAGATVDYGAATATDLVTDQVPTTCTPASGTAFGSGTTTVTCSATDGAHNTGTATFTVTVADTTAPTLSVPANLTVAAAGPAGATATFAKATAADAGDATPTVTCSGASGDVFPLGTTTVLCKAKDASGNLASNSFTVTVQDQGLPIVTVPADRTFEATSATGATGSWIAPTAADDVDGALPVTCSRALGSPFSLGTTTITCTATDKAGNTGTGTFALTVADTTAPAVKVSTNLTATATRTSGAVVSYAAPSSTDLVDGTLPVTCDRASGSVFGLGTTTVLCSVKDKAGNTGSKSFTVTVTYGFGGFADPVTEGRTFNLGNTIPVKFVLTGASTGVSNADARLSATQVGAAKGAAPVTVVASGAANTGNAFRYSDGQYVFNLSTKTLTAGAWRLRADLGDGVLHDLGIQLR